MSEGSLSNSNAGTLQGRDLQQRLALLATRSASFHIGGKADDAFEAGFEFGVDGAGRAAYETFYGDSLIGGVGLRHWGVGGSGGGAHGRASFNSGCWRCCIDVQMMVASLVAGVQCVEVLLLEPP